MMRSRALGKDGRSQGKRDSGGDRRHRCHAFPASLGRLSKVSEVR